MGKTRKVLPTKFQSACLVVLEPLEPLLQGLSQGSVCKVGLCFGAHRCGGKGVGRHLHEKQPSGGEKNLLRNVRSGWKGLCFEGQKLNLNQHKSVADVSVTAEKLSHVFFGLPRNGIACQAAHKVSFKARL